MSMKRKITKFEIIQTWIVRQFKNEFNPIHWHGGHIFGAGFLKVPNYFGEHTKEKGENIYQGGNLNFIDGSHRFLSNSVFKIKPEVGDFYFFPRDLMHTVYPFKEQTRKEDLFHLMHISMMTFIMYGEDKLNKRL